MNQTPLTKRIPFVMWTATILMAIMLLGTLLFAANRANGIAAESSVTMMDGGWSAEVERVAGLVYDYSVWNGAFEAAGTRDLTWLYENMGAGVHYGGFNFMEIYWPKDKTSVVWTSDTDDEIQPSAIDAKVLAEVHRQLKASPVGSVGIISFASEIFGKPYMVSASRIEPEDPTLATDPENLAINFTARSLDEEFVAGIGSRFLIKDLHLHLDGHTEELSLPIYRADGSVFGNIRWTPPKPGLTLANTSLAPLFLSFLIFLVLSRIVARSATVSAQQLMEREQESAILARTDHQTNLPNRLAFKERYEELFETEATIALLFTDLNGFKQINDTKGHATGDALIVGLAKRIEETIIGDVFFARMGGDEFSFIFTGDDAEERLRGFANSLRTSLDAAFYLEGEPFHISMAMGYSVWQKGATLPPEELVRQADTAMYSSKASNSAILVRYDAELDPNRLKELKLEGALRRALDHPEQFSVVYQPIVGSHGEEMNFAEALLRWNSPELGVVSPADFIPIAESSGLIKRVTSIVLEAVIKDLAKAPQMTVSINISPLQINESDFHEELASMVEKHGIRAYQIVIELTEGVLVENPRGLVAALQRLRLLGHKIALDDFGTGYSSIGYLRQMEFSILKVDKTLIRGATKSRRAREILEATIKIARAFNIDILAEGVETDEQARMLADMGFNLQQGFKFGAALPFGELPSITQKAA